MAKVISYKFIAGEVNRGTEENPVIEQVIQDKTIICNTQAQYDANLPIVKKEAYNGEYTIEDDGIEEITTPSTEERFEALEAAVAMLCMPDVSEV